MSHQKLHINKRKKKMPKNHSLSLTIFLTFLLFSSCDFTNSQLLGEYRIKETKGSLATNKIVEALNLSRNGVVKLVYADTTINGRWKEIDVQELNYIELNTGGNLYELHIIRDSTIELYFVSNATDFRGGRYDSLTYIKVK